MDVRFEGMKHCGFVCGDRLQEFIDVGKADAVHGCHVVVPLIGRFKGERIRHLDACRVPFVNEAASGVQIWDSIGCSDSMVVGTVDGNFGNGKEDGMPCVL